MSSPTFTISEEEQIQLRELARTIHDKKTADRIRIILALNNGHSVSEVAAILLLDEPTIRKWHNRYKSRKLLTDWLATSHKGCTGKLAPDQLSEIEVYVETEMVTDAATVVNFIKDKFDEDYTVDGVNKLLHRLGFVYKQTTLIPGKLNEAAQVAFLKEYEELTRLTQNPCHP
jgi:transposase